MDERPDNEAPIPPETPSLFAQFKEKVASAATGTAKAAADRFNAFFNEDPQTPDEDPISTAPSFTELNEELLEEIKRKEPSFTEKPRSAAPKPPMSKKELREAIRSKCEGIQTKVSRYASFSTAFWSVGDSRGKDLAYFAKLNAKYPSEKEFKARVLKDITKAYNTYTWHQKMRVLFAGLFYSTGGAVTGYFSGKVINALLDEVFTYLQKGNAPADPITGIIPSPDNNYLHTLVKTLVNRTLNHAYNAHVRIAGPLKKGGSLQDRLKAEASNPDELQDMTMEDLHREIAATVVKHMSFDSSQLLFAMQLIIYVGTTLAGLTPIIAPIIAAILLLIALIAKPLAYALIKGFNVIPSIHNTLAAVIQDEKGFSYLPNAVLLSVVKEIEAKMAVLELNKKQSPVEVEKPPVSEERISEIEAMLVKALQVGELLECKTPEAVKLKIAEIETRKPGYFSASSSTSHMFNAFIARFLGGKTPDDKVFRELAKAIAQGMDASLNEESLLNIINNTLDAAKPAILEPTRLVTDEEKAELQGTEGNPGELELRIALLMKSVISSGLDSVAPALASEAEDKVRKHLAHQVDIFTTIFKQKMHAKTASSEHARLLRELLKAMQAFSSARAQELSDMNDESLKKKVQRKYYDEIARHIQDLTRETLRLEILQEEGKTSEIDFTETFRLLDELSLTLEDPVQKAILRETARVAALKKQGKTAEFNVDEILKAAYSSESSMAESLKGMAKGAGVAVGSWYANESIPKALSLVRAPLLYQVAFNQTLVSIYGKA